MKLLIRGNDFLHDNLLIIVTLTGRGKQITVVTLTHGAGVIIIIITFHKHFLSLFTDLRLLCKLSTPKRFIALATP